MIATISVSEAIVGDIAVYEAAVYDIVADIEGATA